MSLALCIPFMDDAAGKFRPQLAQLLTRLSWLARDDRPDRVTVGLLERPGIEAVDTIHGVEEGLGRRGAWQVEVDWAVVPAASWRPSVARNLAAVQALEDGADQLVFLDADCLPNDGMFGTVRDQLSSGSAVVLNRLWCVSDELGAVLASQPMGWQFIPDPPKPVTADGRVIYAPGLVLGVRAADFTQVGAYDELLQPGEDEDLVERLRRFGCKFRLFDRLAVHCGRPTDFTNDTRFARAIETIRTRAAQNVTRIDQRWGSGAVAELAS